MSTLFKNLPQKWFDYTSKASNWAITASAVSFAVTGAFLFLYRVTGIPHTNIFGAACFGFAIICAAAAFAPQSASQIVRIVCWLISKLKGSRMPVFREEDPAYAKAIKKAFKAVRERYADNRRSLAITGGNRAPIRKNVYRPRSFARAYRSHSRPSFTHVSNSSGENSDGSCSGDSDSDGPSGPHYPLTHRNSFSQENRKPRTRQNRRGKWRIARQRRRFA